VRRTFLSLLCNPVRALLMGAIRGYQVVISPGLPGRCKFYPSCSQYALDAMADYGAARGFLLAVWRLLRCNPLSMGGYDPVSRQTLFAPRCTHGHSPNDAVDVADRSGSCAAGRGPAPGAQGLRG
jgi:putative membrane protein insertion efficiency factor